MNCRQVTEQVYKLRLTDCTVAVGGYTIVKRLRMLIG